MTMARLLLPSGKTFLYDDKGIKLWLALTFIERDTLLCTGKQSIPGFYWALSHFYTLRYWYSAVSSPSLQCSLYILGVVAIAECHITYASLVSSPCVSPRTTAPILWQQPLLIVLPQSDHTLEGNGGPPRFHQTWVPSLDQASRSSVDWLVQDLNFGKVWIYLYFIYKYATTRKNLLHSYHLNKGSNERYIISEAIEIIQYKGYGEIMLGYQPIHGLEVLCGARNPIKYISQ